MEARKKKLKVCLLLLGIFLSISLVFCGAMIINGSNMFINVACNTYFTDDGNYVNSTNGGTIRINGVPSTEKASLNFHDGQNVVLTATANDGYAFTGFYQGDCLVNENLTYSFVLQNEDVDVQARFAKLNQITFSVANPFDSTDVRQFTATCYVGQNVCLSQLVGENCEPSWAKYFENSKVLTSSNPIEVGGMSGSVNYFTIGNVEEKLLIVQ